MTRPNDPNNKLELRFEKANEYLRTCNGSLCTKVAEALTVQQEYERAQDKAAWEQARLGNTVESITAYVKQYPQGEHTGEASQTLQQLQQAQDDAAWEQAKLVNTEEAINTYIGQYPVGSHAVEARAALGQIMKNQDWQKFKARYDDYMQNGDVVEAAKLLEDRPVSPDTKESEIRATFPALAAEKLSNKVATWKERQEWTEATGYLQQITQIPGDVWSIDQRQQTFSVLSNEIKLAWDRTLYQAAVDFRTRDKMSDYIANAPLGTMRTEVGGYLEYLNQRSGDNDFTLILTRVQWNDNTPNKGNVTFQLQVEGEVVESPLLTGSLYETSAVVNLTTNFKAKYTDSLTMTVQATGSGWFGTELLGISERFRFVVQDMLRGTQLTLRIGDKETGQAFISLSGGVGTEPALPTWREQ